MPPKSDVPTNPQCEHSAGLLGVGRTRSETGFFIREPRFRGSACCKAGPQSFNSFFTRWYNERSSTSPSAAVNRIDRYLSGREQRGGPRWLYRRSYPETLKSPRLFVCLWSRTVKATCTSSRRLFAAAKVRWELTVAHDGEQAVKLL